MGARASTVRSLVREISWIEVRFVSFRTVGGRAGVALAGAPMVIGVDVMTRGGDWVIVGEGTDTGGPAMIRGIAAAIV